MRYFRDWRHHLTHQTLKRIVGPNVVWNSMYPILAEIHHTHTIRT